MAEVTTYKVRSGNSLALEESGEFYVFVFGSETQDLETAECTDTLLSSDDMCFLGGEYFSANYQAIPGLVEGKILFTQSQAKKPILSNETGKEGGSGGGSPSI